MAPIRLADSPPDDSIGVDCPLCRSRLYVRPDQIGQQVTCPDCHSAVPVKAPKPKPAPPPEEEDEDTFRLSEPVDRPPLVPFALPPPDERGDTAPGPAARPADRPSPPKPANAVAERSREVYSKAQAEAEEAARAERPLPPRPFVDGLVSFLFDIQALVRWAVLTALIDGVFTMARYAISLANSGPTGQFMAVGLSMLTAPASLIYLATAAVCFVVVVQDTANNRDKIEQWPGLNFLEWMGDSLYLLNSLFVSALPGVLLGVFLAGIGVLPTWFSLVLGLATAAVLLPVALLSALEEGSPLSVWSPVIWRSLRSARSTWIRFYLLAILLNAGQAIAVAILALPYLLAGLAGAVLLTALQMIYFRLLGRLALCLAQLPPENEAGDASPSEPA